MITLDAVYLIAGLFFAAIALLSALDDSNSKRWRNTGFWGLLAVSFLFGAQLGDFNNGLLAIGLVAIGGFGLGRGEAKTTSPEERRVKAEKFGNALFLPALLVPALTLFGALVLDHIQINGVPIFAPRQGTLISLAFAALIAVLVAMAWLRPPPLAPLQESRRLIDTVGWAALLPQMLAALGAVFAVSGVGKAVGDLISSVIAVDNQFAVVAAYCIGMALFTIIMGNAFAAFPVMTAGIGLPLLVQLHGAEPASLGAIGMLSGYCGTLMTPMAANYNLVPAALLELKDPYGVIRVQAPTGAVLLGCNVVLMYAIVFR